jgi:hypothetical protein
LHAHTTWSDGTLGVAALVDLYGQSGFDVLCITDHVVRQDIRWIDACDPVTAPSFPAYLAEIHAEAERARRRYDMVLIAGLELTFDDPDPANAGHAVAVGVDRFVGVDQGLEHALVEARASGAAAIAAHPYSAEAAMRSYRGTGKFAADLDGLSGLVDRFELINRHEVFTWVADKRLPVVASGDFHRPEHLATWKTLMPCERSEEAIVDYLRSSRPTFLVQVQDGWHAQAA